MHDHGLITETSELEAFIQTLSEQSWVAVDTEFMREKTYHPQLCLIQLATLEHIGCVDPLALGDLSPLIALLNDPSILKVFHAASQDMEVLYHVTGKVPVPIFDTQIAASLLGHGEQIGYANLVQNVLSRDLDKTQARTDWSRRPLQTNQLVYARDDVRYLAQMFVLLREELSDAGRLEWLQPEMDALSNPENYHPDPQGAWRRVSGHKRMKPKELAVLRELAAWRENEALALDRPRRWILSDDVLVAVARARPADRRTLQDLRGFPKSLRDHQVDTFLEAVHRGVEAPRESWPEIPRPRPLTESEEVLADMTLALLRELARLQNVGPEAVGSRRDVIALIRDDATAALARGWRQQVAGLELQRWLAGETQLRCAGRAVEIRDTAADPVTRSDGSPGASHENDGARPGRPSS
jgi:ribonuclease D